MNGNNRPLSIQTLSLALGFMIWVILSSLMPFIKEDISLSSGQLALVTATPILFGSLLRIPAGYWTNRYGARVLFIISFLLLLAPIYWISIADSFIDLIIGGVVLGIGGAVFSVGVTSLPKYYPKEKHGLVNGIYGVGNLGTAITAFAAPVVANHMGWEKTVLMYAVLLAIFIGINFLLGDKHEPKSTASLTEQIKGVYKNEKLWLLCLFYFITFGSFVAFTVYLPNFLVSHFELTKVDAGIRTAGFIVLATIMRPVGGWMGDRWNPFTILMAVFGGLTLSAVILSFAPSIEIYTVGCLTIALCAGTGNGTIFKLVPMYFSKQAGIANGLISAMGGLGGFFPPLLLTALFNLTGHYAIGFMALSQVALASLILVIWMYYQEKLSLTLSIMDQTSQGIMVTDPKGFIQSVNGRFTEVTGYLSEEAVGQTASLLKSGKQDKAFYAGMWASLQSTGSWQGEIWNRRKNGEVYPEWLTINCIRNDAGEIKCFAAMFSDMTPTQ
ncbi:NNP family nitrate/nitrite transporter-like MFS transporter [Paenibacillus endophyticus]|uniref:NNP family nitrate/nitrite transporter-like MFS transporter n=1 Tax=Paenibacillus endophyticus TaxID=1294268 RepID=A0A7W5GBL3_9BACL|nr:nitrate/nitrite transporter [Paenibacillus endophyticus]MBB3153518.1 NNP family nitrate/nitrite transporter-like MFS transporter [Paenibacillus endophyticus]